MLQPRCAPLHFKHRSTSRRCARQTTDWVFNTQQLPVLATYREAQYSNNRPTNTSTPSLFLFTYDMLGNLNQFTQLINGKIETGKLTAYNANGAFLAGTSTTNQAVKHSYTPRGQLATTSVANQVTTYTYDAIGQSKQITYPNGDTLNYTYDAAHKLKSIKWNGIEQYTPVAGLGTNLSSNLASLVTLGGYSGITNPELAYKLGVNVQTLDGIDAAPKVLSEATNAAAFRAVELAKDAVIGKEARAQIVLPPPRILPPAIGGGSISWGLPSSWLANIGFTIDSQGYVRNSEN